MSEGVVLIITGLFMKVMIGDAGGRIADHIFASPEYYSSLEFLCALLIFSVQIYADFSGYSNIARGTAKLLGVDLMRNFAQPYLSANISEFWRRWHISLSSWLRDYLYISLGGNRKGRGRTFINLMLTMLLGGLWHGANWTFVIWGALHGTYLVIHKLMLGDSKPQIHYTYAGIPGFLNYFVKALLTYILVLLTWLFFRAENLQQVALFFQMMAEFTIGDYAIRIITITSTFMIVTFLYDILQYRFGSDVFLLKLRSRALTTGILGGLFLTTLLYMFVEEPLPFVYFQF
jgi:D-alanyl-lipoteichoic acid acyltransferase DltB (MBOAT superfamily)